MHFIIPMKQEKILLNKQTNKTHGALNALHMLFWAHC